MERLMPCPFCGGQAAQRNVYSYNFPAAQIYCLNCRCSTPVLPTGYDPLNRREISLPEVSERVMTIWNSRREERAPA